MKALCDANPDQVVAIAGNHERWLLDWLGADDADPTWLVADAGFVIMRSFLPSEIIEQAVAELAGGSIETVNGVLKHEIRAPSRRPDRLAAAPAAAPRDRRAPYVHAGIDEEAGPLWESMTTDEVLTEKFPPSLGKPSVGKTIVAGHTGVGPLHAREGRMRCWEPFVDEGHVYLDGRVEDTGQLNVMRYDSRTHTTMFL